LVADHSLRAFVLNLFALKYPKIGLQDIAKFQTFEKLKTMLMAILNQFI